MDPKHARDPELWFADGNLVLQAEQTLFRVYAGILSRASTIIKDILVVGHPQPDNAAEQYDECPLVAMCGDSASDVRAFLSALYAPRYVVYSTMPFTLF